MSTPPATDRPDTKDRPEGEPDRPGRNLPAAVVSRVRTAVQAVGGWPLSARVTGGALLGVLLVTVLVAAAVVGQWSGNADDLRGRVQAERAAQEELSGSLAAAETRLARAVDRHEAELDDLKVEHRQELREARSDLARLQQQARQFDARERELAGRESELDARAASLDERDAALTVAEHTEAQRSFGTGTWRVGEEIQPGTYRTAGGSNMCYWARLRNFDGGLNSIIANGIAEGPATVRISPSDAGFESQGCSTWERVD